MYNRSMLREFSERLKRLGIKDKDIIEKFIRSGGPGGQKVNKSSSCVYVKHLPSGIEVKMSRERSQALNRFLAWRLLTEKLETQVLRIKSEQQKKIEKIRRQKRKRSKRAKEKVLQQKKLRSEKKKQRKVSKADWH
ncbi:MAG: peptide chain release factor-like protein [Candidatus Margulisbacteria bacterium]|nr:peptide chain release factor-like protein [Candidatus Margulisiibacteriota bacterium]